MKSARPTLLLRLGSLTPRGALPVVTGFEPEAVAALRQVLGEYADWQGYVVPINPSHTPAATGFGFHTKAAEVIWNHARKVANAHPKDTTAAIVLKAIELSGLPASELTPEDSKLLEMAVNWYLAGKVGAMTPVGPPYGGNNASGTQKNFPDTGSL